MTCRFANVCVALTCFPCSLRSLLIAMMNNTYNLISADALKYWCAVTLFLGTACSRRRRRSDSVLHYNA